MSLENGLTLFTSDSRPKYANDALSVIALPSGSKYQFRYESRYLPPQVKHAFEPGSAEGVRVLIAFRSEQTETKDPFIVPLRWAEVSSVRRIADFFLVQFVLGDHPLFCRELVKPTAEKICTASASYIGSCAELMRPLPVHVGLTSLVESQEASAENCWLAIAQALAEHPAFSDTHFLRIADLTDARGEKLPQDTDGHYLVPERKYSYVSVDYFAGHYGDHDSALEVSTDTEIIRVASGASIPLDSRYDSTRIWLQSLEVAGDSLTEIQVETRDNRDSSPQTRIRLPLKVRRSKYGLVAQILVSALGAGCVAMPGLLGKDFDLQTRIVFVAIGAFLLALSPLLKRGK